MRREYWVMGGHSAPARTTRRARLPDGASGAGDLLSQRVLRGDDVRAGLREIRRLEDLAELKDALAERDPLGPLHSLLARGHLDDPEPRDELLGLRERPVDDDGLVTVEVDPRPL